ncbi:YqaJ viral recombinase family protein [Gimesia fumaroli]|uniref:YqaJ-like viral recombinase domain protein n=1 Tax=Gimesia fumaroli TaxID=2527976 RepID=A0A518I8Z6_9PLAN|nr:YqaJ viral recombinase family protein [Gimesia fumaroli]QDV49588.1 YqaJ-like viral recombinase domain protein [Gimesia fumaroli]
MSTATYEPIKVADPDTPEWEAARMTGIGASESADALELSQYGGRYKLFHRKIGTLQEDFENDDMWYGKEVEYLTAKYWERKNNRKILQHPCPMYRHPDYPFILATPDAKLSPKEGLELKSMHWRLAKEMGEEGTDFIPDSYVIQGQQQMFVMGWEVVNFAILVDRRLYQYKVHRNETLIEGLVAGLSEMWERIQNFDEPEPNWENPSVADTVKRLYRDVEKDSVIELSKEACKAWNRYELLGDDEKQIQEERKALKAFVLKELGNRSAGILAGGKKMVRRKEIQGCSYTVERKPRIDARAVKVPE